MNQTSASPRRQRNSIMEEGENPYEALDPSATVTTHMLAGAAAGVMEHTVMYPVDCVKTRMQCLVPDPKADYRNIADALSKIVHQEGIKNTVRGFSAMALGAGPAHAFYFATYEKVKSVLSDGKFNTLAHGCAGCAATLVHDSIMVPADAIKQRMQVYGSPYKTTLNCIQETYHKEGVRAFYRSYTTQLTMNIPFQAVTIMTYEYMKDLLNHDRKYDPKSHIVAGAVAGAVAATITMPLDVCKTLLNTQEHCARTRLTYINGMAAAFRTVYEFRGISGFYRGLSARVFYQIPSTGISWSVYEFFKYVIHTKRSASQSDDRYFNSIPLPVASVSKIK